MKEAPLFVDAYDLALELCERMAQGPSSRPEERHGPLRQRIVSHGFSVLEHATLALKGFDTHEEVMRTDRALASLRVFLRLAVDLDLLDRSSFHGLAERMDGIGRQLGGWMRRLGQV